MTNETTVAPAVRGGGGNPLDSEDMRIAVRCNICRRWLTDPQSVVLGAGPACRGDRG